MTYYKKRRFLDFSKQRKVAVLFFFLTVVASAGFACVSIASGAGWRNIGALFPLIYFSLLFAATYYFALLKKILKKAYKPLISIFYSGMAAVFLIFIIFCVLVFGYSSGNIPQNPDLSIVLGCQVFDYVPGTMLKHRLESAFETINKYPGAFCIVTGGQGPDETVPEAVAMKKYLVNKGADGGRIFEESKSSSSYENLIFSKKIIDENNLKHENIIIVTSNYHIPRAILIAKRVYPESNIYAVKAYTPFNMIGAGIIREFFAFVKSYIFDKV